MKILQINSVCGIGSTGRIATDIHNILIEQGNQSYIAYGRDLPKNCDNAIRIGTKIDNYAHVAKTRLLDKHGFGSKKATKEFIEKVKELDPDIIHLHNIHGYYINIEVLFNYLKEANKPVIWTLHDCWAFTGHCSHFDYIGCEKWKTGCFDCPQKNEYPKSLIVDNSQWNFEKKKEFFKGIENLTIVTPSKWLTKLVEESFLGKYRIKVIHNGVDLEIFKPINSDFRKNNNILDKYIILGVANVWTEKKGFHYFLQLAKELEENEVIVLVGLTEKQKKVLPRNFIGISRTHNIKELAEIYSTADVYLNPTLEDNFPTVNLEAQACGTPVVTFDTGGSPESIDVNTGRVVEKGNLNQVINEIYSIKQKPLPEYQIIERSKKYYKKSERYQEYLNLYTSLLRVGEVD